MLEEPTSTGEDGVNTEEPNSASMGATRNLNIARITALQERKKQIEDILAKRNQELRQLCIQEAELTGITPPEMPLEPGETPPLIRRRIGTSYQLPEKLVKNANNKDKMITDLEIQIQLHANMAEAALGLANEQNMTKTMKRQHRTEYQKHQQKCLELQEKLALLKEKAATEQHKQKKKPRVPEIADDTVSLSTNSNEQLLKPDARHSVLSAKHSVPSSNEPVVDPRFSQDVSRHPYRYSEIPHVGLQPIKPDDPLNSGFYRLSLNGYSEYMERRENINNVYSSSSYNPHSASMYHLYGSQIQPHQQHALHYQQHSPHMSQHSPHMSQHSPHLSQHSPHLSQHSPHRSQQSPVLPQHSPHLSQHSPHYSHLSQTSSQSSLHSHHSVPHHSPRKVQHSPQPPPQLSHQRISQYPQYSPDFPDMGLTSHRQPSPTASLSPKTQYYPSHAVLSRSTYRNSHQIQPHQQYEQMNVVNSGLGGCWKKTGNGELVWYTSNTIDASWQRDKRFGSLDRRKTKKASRISPNLENKSATISTVPNYHGQGRSSVKTSKIINRRSQDNGQLVRTQSLGSVGAITLDSVYPTDDSSSYGSDNRVPDGNVTLKKPKEKEWLETSLDGPAFSAQPTLSSSQPQIPLVFTPEEKPPLEIPAESNPSVKIRDTNIEIFNNNIPKNCTVVQAGHCKPYHEETKPFEMADFYKYSTKYKKSPVKSEGEPDKSMKSSGSVHSHRSLNEKFENGSKPGYSPIGHTSSSNTSNPGKTDGSTSLNTSLNLDHIAVSENFSDEMNAWYKDQRKNNNNPSSPSKSRSTATLV
nr:FERM domain-containing protein 4B [Leptinotarsa decemlineata]XP_023016626.1 FERM domain-containing protein 4B [Leptinotarsa decemlineata]